MEEKLFGLIGRKLSHSFSVSVHRELGNPGYRLIELEPEELESFLSRKSIGGLNVTIPYKKTVMSCCGCLSGEAEAIGSVNTIVPRGGKLCGFNTDSAGFSFMAKRAGVDFTGRKTLIFGSGGASLTAQAAARAAGASEVVVISRSGPDNYENLSRHFDAEILVNATPLGMYPQPGAMPADPALFKNCAGVLDMVYNPRRTAFLMRAEELGLPCSDGLPMLVEQARAAEELFTGNTIDRGETPRILRLLRRETCNIVLIGMPGSGKTTVGRLLAEKTGREAVDIDAEIEKSSGVGIPELFALRGEKYFRALEREAVARVGMESGKIIMTGGGVVTDARNYPPLRQNGRIYHLVRELSALPADGRPLSQKDGAEELYRRRAPLYEAFRDAEISNDFTPQDAAEAIWRDFCENSCD